MFVLMIGALALLSDDPPEPALDAGYGDRFRYWRGASGRRYLFSLVPADALADFSSVVVMVAERRADGRLIGRALVDVGEAGYRYPVRFTPSETPFVHFMALSRDARRRLIEDLAAAPVRLAA
jgi:hypothetical protein